MRQTDELSVSWATTVFTKINQVSLYKCFLNIVTNQYFYFHFLIHVKNSTVVVKQIHINIVQKCEFRTLQQCSKRSPFSHVLQRLKYYNRCFLPRLKISSVSILHSKNRNMNLTTKVKCSLCSTKHHSIKTCWGAKV